MAEAFLTPLSLLATIVKTAPDALLVVDRKGRIMFANEQIEQLLDLPREELMGEPIEAVLPGGSESDTEEGEGVPQTALARDGRKISVEVRSSSVPFEGGVLVARSIRDVTGRERAEREARQLLEELAHVGRVSALGELVSAVAHEINQPLAAIMSNAQAAQRFLDRDSPDLAEVKSALGDIVSEDRRASEVIKQLRSMMRRELRDPGALELGALISDMERLVRKDAEERGIDLERDVRDSLPPVRGDRIQLQQVLLNLMLNAFDAVGEVPGGDHRVRIEGWSEGETVELAVRDSGPGLEEGSESTVFDSFVTTKKQGLGMGLSICRTVIEAHEGRIWAENHPEGGALFRISLPVAII
jgi:two-component system sensor kinase FixL